MDGRVESTDQEWVLAGKLSSSRVGGSVDAISRTQRSSTRYMDRPDASHLDFDTNANSLGGVYRKLDLIKQTGTWQGRLGLTGITPGYEVNDLGFQSWADRVEVASEFGYRQPRAGRHFRTLDVTVGTTSAFNLGGDAVASEVALFVGGQHASFNRFRSRFARRFEAWNDRLTRGGPLTREPAGYSGSVGLNTDRRAVWQFSGGFDFEGDDGGGWTRSGNLGFQVRFAEIYQFNIGAEITREGVAAQYVDAVADSAATHTFQTRYVFAPLDHTTVGIEARFNVTFSPDLTFELYAQPFMSSGDYGGLIELAATRSFNFRRYGEGGGTVLRGGAGQYVVDPEGTGAGTFEVEDPDFDFRSLLGNAVLRWEWRPGSTLFLVWQQTRSAELVPSPLEGDGKGVGHFAFGSDGRDLFRLKPDNVFLIKVAYWLNP